MYFSQIHQNPKVFSSVEENYSAILTVTIEHIWIASNGELAHILVQKSLNTQFENGLNYITKFINSKV